MKLLIKPPQVDIYHYDQIGMEQNIRHSTFGLNPLLWPTPPHVLNLIQNYQRQLWPVAPVNLTETPRSSRISPLNYTTESLT